MKRAALSLVSTLLLTFPAQAQTLKLADLAAMAGCWEQRNESKNLLITEQWMKPAGNAMLGMARTVRNGKVTGYEYMRIEQTGDGLAFISKPKENKDETLFKLVRSTRSKFVFENPTHDFPQRVIYEVGNASLTGRIEGQAYGKDRVIDFPMKRVKCD